MNILNDDWIETDRGRFSALTLATTDTGATSIVTKREDWEFGIYEMLIGIASRLRGADAASIAGEFEMIRFMQRDAEKPREFPPEFLLIDAMNGESAFWANKPELAGHDALLALYTYQSRAVAGGRGYATSIRGGSALTVMNWGDSVWERIQRNISDEWEGFFTLPRAIRLIWDGDRVASVRTGGAALQYTGPAHPLCIIRQEDNRPQLMPRHGLNYASARLLPDAQTRNHVLMAGYEMDNMKPLQWCSKSWRFDALQLAPALERHDALRTLFCSALRRGKYSESDPRAKTDRHTAELARFYDETEPAFMDVILNGGIQDYTRFSKEAALAIYDSAVEIESQPRRYAEGRRILAHLKIYFDREAPPMKAKLRKKS